MKSAKVLYLYPITFSRYYPNITPKDTRVGVLLIEYQLIDDASLHFTNQEIKLVSYRSRQKQLKVF